jgi:5-methylcytosine-specific restriction endonuclease McrA
MKARWKLYAGVLTLLIASLPSAQAGNVGASGAWEALRSKPQEAIQPTYYYRRHYGHYGGYHRPYYGHYYGGYRRPYYGHYGGYRRHNYYGRRYY